MNGERRTFALARMSRGMWWVTTLLILLLAALGCGPDRRAPARRPDGPKALPAAKDPPERKEARTVKIAVVYRSEYEISLGGIEKAHPFDVHKYGKIHKRLLKKRLLRRADTYESEQITPTDVLRIHTKAYIASLRSSETAAKFLEMPMIAALPSSVLENGILKPFRYATGGTLLAARLALKTGAAVNIGGGFHHAKPHTGEGFCLFADIPIAIRALQGDKSITRALIVDVDVHQGNGTAVCLAGDKTTFTFSMHQRDIYPIPKEKSDLDVELESGTDDATFLKILGENLPKVFAAARPDIVFLVAGCDTLAGDPLASLKMTVEGLVKRDALVIDAAVKRGVPIVMTLAGGYGKNAARAQYESVANLIKTYGLARNPAGRDDGANGARTRR